MPLTTYTAGQVLTAQSLNDNFAFAVETGLSFITGAAFTTATSVSLPDNTFSSTYRNYKMILTITAVTSDADFSVRLRASGSDNTTSNYNTMLYGGNTNAVGAALGNGNVTSFLAGEQDAGVVRYTWNFDILQPQIAQNTYLSGELSFVDKAATATFARTGVCTFAATTQFDSLSFISSVASSITGTYRVYGYSDS
jgi:hypothetical protein